MARDSITVALAGGLLLFMAGLSSAYAGQQILSLRLETFVERCNRVGVFTDGGAGYQCAGLAAQGGSASVTCMFSVQGTFCTWPPGSEGFARAIVESAPAPGRMINSDAGAGPATDLTRQVQLPSFAGPRSEHSRP